MEAHGGYKGSIGEDGSWFIQAGPALVSPDGGEEDVNSLVRLVLTKCLKLMSLKTWITGMVSISFETGGEGVLLKLA